MPTGRVRRLGTLYLTFQGLAVAVWWLQLGVRPALRPFFLAPGETKASLLAFFVPDLFGYVGGSLATAYGLWRRRAWAWPVLCVHAGAAAYAALYGVTLPLLSGGGWGSLLMLPSLFVPPFLAWRLRPRGGGL